MTIQKAKVIAQPMGRHGLEGYQIGDIIKVEHKPKDKNGKPYYRVWPNDGLIDDSGYYETCSVGVFKKYFKIYNNW